MKVTTLLLPLAIALGLGLNAQAQISVGLSGAAANPFATTPPAAEWASATAGIGTAGATAYTTAADVDGAMVAVNQSSFATVLATTAANGTSAAARRNTTDSNLVTQPTTVGILGLKATLRNTSGGALSHLTVAYDFGVAVATTSETAPGHQVYFSTNGLPGSWEKINAFSGLNAAASLSETLFVGTWLPNTDIYVLFADDNSNANPDGGYTIDNFAVTSVVATNVPIPLSVTLNAPANGLTGFQPTNITASATTAGSTPATSVSFYTNDVLAVTDASAPFSAVLSTLPAGTYAIYAQAVNGADPDAYSTTNTVRVLPVINYTGGTISEDFNIMGEAGTITPAGWYVSAAPAITSTNVTAGDGSIAPATAILGWNYGTTADADRALGTSPTGAERNMAVAIQNNTGSNMTTMEIHFDGEVWRNYTNAVVTGVLSNSVSIDGGATWVATGLYFSQPLPSYEPVGAVNGNDPANRTADINGVITLPAPLPVGAVLFIRWWDANEGGTDGGLAIDNFSFQGGFGAFVASANLASPTNGATFAEASLITLTATANLAAAITNFEFFHDGTSIGSDTTAPYSVGYSNATVGLHTLTATAMDATGASVTTSNTVIISVNPNVGPSVTVTNPVAGAEFLVGVTVTNVSASAADTDGAITIVEFYVNGVLLRSDNTSPYGFDLCNITAGSNTIAAVATDNAGARATNSISITATNPPGLTAIVTNGALWQYLDDGTDQGTAWQALTFDDSGWSNGVAELGYGDATGRPERTTVGFGPNANSKYPTTYFRKKFVVTDPAAFANYVLSVLADDRYIVYLNGVLVTHNITNTPVANVIFSTLTPAAIPHDGTVYDMTNLPPNVLVAGTNIVAVEVHQESIGSSDISFDLMLWGAGAPAAPSLTIAQTDATHAQVSWGADATGYTLQVNSGDIGTPGDWSDLGGVISGAGSVPVSFPPPDRKMFRLRKP